MAMLLHADGTVEEVQPTNGTDFQLDELQGFVGGYIEIVPLHGTTQILVVNEEGKLTGLPVNPAATAVWEVVYGPTDVVVGDALFCDTDQVL